MIAFSLLYGGGLTGRAFLLKGIVDDVALENARVDSLQDLLKRPAAKQLDQRKLREERRELKERVRKNFARTALAGVLADPGHAADPAGARLRVRVGDDAAC